MALTIGRKKGNYARAKDPESRRRQKAAIAAYYAKQNAKTTKPTKKKT